MIVTVMEGYNLILYGNVIPLLLDDRNLAISEETVGFIGGVVYLGAIVGVIVATAVADRVGRQRVLAVAAFTFALGSVIVALADSPTVLGLGRVVTGIGAGASVTTAMTLARNAAPVGRVSLVLTVTMAGIPLGGTLAALLSLWLMPGWGWRPMFWVGAVMTVAILGLLALVRISEPSEVREAGLGGSRRFLILLAGRAWILVVLVLLAAFLNMVTWFGINVWLTESMRDLGFSLSQALTFVFVLTGASVVASFGIAALADRFGAARVAGMTAVVVVAGLAGLLRGPTTMWAAVILVALLGIGGHSTQILINSTASSATVPQLRGTMLGVMNVMANVGSFLGPSIGGFAFARKGADGVFAVYCVSAVGSVALCVAMFVAYRAMISRARPTALHSAAVEVG